MFYFSVACWKQSPDLFVMLQLCLLFPVASDKLNEERVSEDELAKATFRAYLLVVSLRPQLKMKKKITDMLSFLLSERNEVYALLPV